MGGSTRGIRECAPRILRVDSESNQGRPEYGVSAPLDRGCTPGTGQDAKTLSAGQVDDEWWKYTRGRGESSVARHSRILLEGKWDVLGNYEFRGINPERSTITSGRLPLTVGGLAEDLFEAVPAAVVITDRRGRIALINGRTEAIFGYRREELLDQPVEILAPLVARPRHAAHVAAYAQAPHARPMGIGLELAGRRRDGSHFPIEISLSALETTDGLLLLSAIRDVTDRRQVQEVLHRQAQLLDLSHDAVIVRDPRGVILSWNRGAVELYGWDVADALGRVSHELLQARFPESRSSVDEHLRTAGGWDGELTHVRRDRTEVIVESRQVVRRDERGETVDILEINRDITARRLLERQQRELIAMVSHDLMSPVTGITLHAEILQMTESYNDRVVGSIMQSSRRLARLVNDLQDLARLDAGRLSLQFGRVDLVPLVRSAGEQLQAATAKHAVRLEIPIQSVPGVWDGVRLEQVLTNLLSNAVKYSPDGGEVLVRLEARGDRALVSITDQGPGIPAEVLPRLFERFYRAPNARQAAQGLGLGLYITRSLVEAHGGWIDVESEIGRGSTFRFSVPYAAPRPAESGLHDPLASG